MSDHADTVRDTIQAMIDRGFLAEGSATLAALDALVEERDEARREANDLAIETGDLDRYLKEWKRTAEAAEADRDRYAAALHEIAHVATDLPHARRLDRERMREVARAALKDETCNPRVASKFGATDSDSLRGVTRTSERGVAVEMVGASHLEAPGVRCPGGGPETTPAPVAEDTSTQSEGSPEGNDGASGAGRIPTAVGIGGIRPEAWSCCGEQDCKFAPKCWDADRLDKDSSREGAVSRPAGGGRDAQERGVTAPTPAPPVCPRCAELEAERDQAQGFKAAADAWQKRAMDVEKDLGYAWEEWNAMDAQVRAAADTITRAESLVEDVRRVQEKARLQIGGPVEDLGRLVETLRRDLEYVEISNSEMAAFIGHKGLGDEFMEWALAQRAEIDGLLAVCKCPAGDDKPSHVHLAYCPVHKKQGIGGLND